MNRSVTEGEKGGLVMLHPNPNRNLFGRLFLLSALLLCPAAGAQTQEREDVVRVESELAQTDVMVFDKSGKFVDGLGREQFELKVDGRPVPVAFFERVSAPVRKGDAGAAPGAAAAAANAAVASRSRGRTVVFFVDDLHLSLDSLNPTRAALTRFIDEEMVAGDLVAVVTASGQLGFLQQFTDNKAVLRAAVARLRNVPNTTRDTEQPPMSEFVATRIANGDRQAAAFYIDKFVESSTTRGAVKAGVATNLNAVYEMVRSRATNITKQMEAVTNGSLMSLLQLVRLAGQIEGRKLVFFISDGFYLDGRNTTAQAANNRLQLVTDEAARSGTVLYTIDARGLFAPFGDATGQKPMDPNGSLERASVGEASLAQEGLANLADETGGQFLKNQNYFDRWVSRVMDETSNFYRIAWKPEADDQKGGRFRRVEVAVAGRPDLTVRLHRGYVPAAVRAAEEAKEKPAAKSDAKGAAPKAEAKGAEADFRAALAAPEGRRGLPTALSASYVDVPGTGAVLTTSVEVGAATLDYGADGRAPASVDLVGVVYSDQGKPVTNFSKRLTVAPPSSASGEQPGIIYNHRAPLAPGLYQVKAAARDSRGGQVGSAVQWVEIPDLSKKQLSLSSLHLGGRQVGGGADGSAPQIQFSVDRRFARSSKVDFLGFVYNAARAGGGGAVDLSVTVKVLRDNKAVVSSPARKLAPGAGDDLGRIPVTGAISLGQLPPGRYELEVGVADNVARATAAERVVFEIK